MQARGLCEWICIFSRRCTLPVRVVKAGATTGDLEIKYKGLSIADILDLTVQQASEVLSPVPALSERLRVLREVGLGYLRLGQARKHFPVKRNVSSSDGNLRGRPRAERCISWTSPPRVCISMMSSNLWSCSSV